MPAASYAVCGLGLQCNVSVAALKDLPPAELVEQIRVLHAGGSPVSPIIARQLLTRFAAKGPESRRAITEPESALLSEQEIKVLTLSAKGFSYDEIAGLGANVIIDPVGGDTDLAGEVIRVLIRDLGGERETSGQLIFHLHSHISIILRRRIFGSFKIIPHFFQFFRRVKCVIGKAIFNQLLCILAVAFFSFALAIWCKWASF